MMRKLKANIRIWLFITGCVFWVSPTLSATHFPDRYDAQIKDAARMWLPGLDWRLLKAQLYQESLLKPYAVSPVGAKGLGQFMPGTWADVSTAMGFAGVSVFSEHHNIQASAYYMARLRKGWSSPRPEKDRHSLAMASYNAGFGNLLKAQKLCGGKRTYDGISKCLPAVTGHHSKETLTYVRRIWRFFLRMKVRV